MKENKNNKTVLIISLIAILLVSLGVTFAYFIRSAIANTTEVSSETLELSYQENRDYMLDGLIPSSKADALKGALNQDNDSKGICRDKNDDVVCNLYEFTVTNVSNVSQDIDFYLYQQINQYSNLKYMIYNTSINGHTYTNETLMKDKTSLKFEDNVAYPGMKLSELSSTLRPNNSVTYTILFYLEETGLNQVEDMNKKVLADVHVIGHGAGKYSNSLPNTVE